MPVDFSANSEKALDYGLRLAQLTQASVILLHVYKLPEFSGLLPEASTWQIDYPEIKKSLDAAMEAAKERLAKMAHRVREAGSPENQPQLVQNFNDEEKHERIRLPRQSTGNVCQSLCRISAG